MWLCRHSFLCMSYIISSHAWYLHSPHFSHLNRRGRLHSVEAIFYAEEILTSFHPDNTQTMNVLSSHGGNVTMETILSILSIFNGHDDSIILDLGSGFGHFINTAQFMFPYCRCVGFETDLSRILLSREMWQLFQTLGSSPVLNIVHQSFTNDTIIEFLKEPNLFIFFNNYGSHFLFDGIQQQIVALMETHCTIGTSIVSFDHMYLNKNFWA